MKYSVIATNTLLLGIDLGLNKTLQAKELLSTDKDNFKPNAFIAIEPSGKVTIWATRTEVGQGIKTALPRVVADELEADWNRVTVVQADADSHYGNQYTEATMSVISLFTPMRKAGAAARMLLEQAAANIWNVDVGSCHAQNHKVIHSSGKSLEFSQLTSVAKTLTLPEEIKLKSPEQFNLIGKSVNIVDLADITIGKAQYGIDIKLPNMLYAAIEHCPKPQGSIIIDNRKEILNLPGIEKVFDINLTLEKNSSPPALALVAKSRWQAMTAKKQLQIKWHSSEQVELQDTLKNWQDLLSTPGKQVHNQQLGTNKTELTTDSISAVYQTAYMNHAALEPVVCLVHFHDGICEVWAPVSTPQVAQSQISKLLGLPKTLIKLHVTLTGGSFGRKGYLDFILEAVTIAKHFDKPVQLLWSREDEIGSGPLSVPAVQKLQANLGNENFPISWHHRAAFPAASGKFQDWEFDAGMRNLPYKINDVKGEYHEVKSPRNVTYMRGVNSYFWSFAINSFVDELAHKTNNDPLQYQLDFIGEDRQLQIKNALAQDPLQYPLDTKRLKNVIRAVAKLSNWQAPLPKNEALGIACSALRLSYVAHVVKVRINDDKSITVTDIYSAVDCGLMINPDSVKAQVEGGIIFGLACARSHEITTNCGVIEQSNFHDYPVPRINQVPNIEIQLITNNEKPTGIGECAVPPLAPALCNAIFAATGKRIRRLPLKHSMDI